ncbi:hypothetical protein CF327_g7749 [Tilletia walkeri]|nr:hypothetical protein CF327_g7749 [Tilletia walkeri]
MNLKHLLGLFALTNLVSALTTGPYNVGSGHFNSQNTDSQIFSYNQGNVNTVVNQSIACNVLGPGLSLTSASFRLEAVSSIPSRANGSTTVLNCETKIRVGIPSSLTSYFAKAGASSLTVNYDGTVLGVKFLGYGESPVVARTGANGYSKGTVVQFTGASYTTVPLGVFRLQDPNEESKNMLALVPSRRVVFQRDLLTISLSAAGKTVTVTCAPGARPEKLAVTNVANLPVWSGYRALIALPTPPKNYNPGSPPLNSTSVVSSYRPGCTFSGLGKQSFEISLGGFKSNKAISGSSPGVFSRGQSNFWISPSLVSFFQTKYPSTNTVSIKLSAFNVSISNATPSIKNLIPTAGYAASAKVGSGGFATFPSAAPSATYPSATFTPIASSIGKGQIAILSYDNVAGSVKLFDANSTAIATVAFSCSEGAGNFPSIVPFDIA